VHHFHLLQWAEIESRALTQEANSRIKITERLETAQKAMGVVDYALSYYPHDADLLDSKSALAEFLTSIKLSHLIEKAERAAFNGSHARALKHYKDALFLLSHEYSGNAELDSLGEKINGEIGRLKQLTGSRGSPREDSK
jgi:hypothetical protein